MENKTVLTQAELTEEEQFKMLFTFMRMLDKPENERPPEFFKIKELLMEEA